MERHEAGSRPAWNMKTVVLHKKSRRHQRVLEPANITRCSRRLLRRLDYQEVAFLNLGLSPSTLPQAPIPQLIANFSAAGGIHGELNSAAREQFFNVSRSKPPLERIPVALEEPRIGSPSSTHSGNTSPVFLSVSNSGEKAFCGSER